MTIPEFSKTRWYGFCDEHRKKIELKQIQGRFDPIEDDWKCEWKRDFFMGDKRFHACREKAKWEFYPGHK